MEATMPARAAARAIMESGRPRLGSEIVRQEMPRRSNVRAWLLSFVLLLIVSSWLTVRDSNRIIGWAVKGEASLADANLLFVSRNGGEYWCRTNSEGDFSLSVPRGNYKIFRLEKGKRIKSPSVLRCESDAKFRIFFDR